MSEPLTDVARRRADWCEAWANRENVKRPQVTPEWIGLIDDVRALADRLSAAETAMREIDQMPYDRDGSLAWMVRCRKIARGWLALNEETP